MREEKTLFTIRKTAAHKKGSEILKALDEANGILPVKVIPVMEHVKAQNETTFYVEDTEKENAIGRLENSEKNFEEILQMINSGIEYAIVLTGRSGNIMNAEITMKIPDIVRPVAPETSESLQEIMDKVVSAGFCTKEEAERNVRVMRENRCPEAMIIAILKTYRKYDKPGHTPKTCYVDTEPKSRKKSILGSCLLETLNHSAIIYEGDRSVGKNVAAETVAMVRNQPYYLITFNRGMAGDDIWGTKSTDNSAVESLSYDGARSYLQAHQYMEEGKAVPDSVMQKAAEYELSKAKAASVSIVQEISTLAEWLKKGGVMMFNEMNMAEANFFAGFANQILDGTGFIDVPGYGRISVNPDCILIGSQNADYTGCCEQNEATMSRFGTIQFPFPSSIKGQLKAAVKTELDEQFYTQADELYKVFLKAVHLGEISNSCLNIRGFVRALEACAVIPGYTSLLSEIEIHVINTCPALERDALLTQAKEKITL